MKGIKYYPKSATTNSTFGISKLREVNHLIKIMEEEDIPLLIHGESIKNDVDIFDRESVFLKEELLEIITTFPNLRVVLEHITTKEAVDFVLEHNIHATITPHHMVMDRNDIFYHGINPHHYCLPILKRRSDKEALINAAISGKPNFFMGTDSAPHYKEQKLSSCGCAGIFNCQVAIELVADIFYRHNMVQNLEKFISTNGCDFYNLQYNNKYINILKEDWVVPKEYEGIVPLYSNRKIEWKIENTI